MNPDDHATYEITEADMERSHEAARGIVAAAQKVGLYSTGATQMGTVTAPDGSLRLFVVSVFSAGEFAFSDRVQAPEEADINDEFIGLQNQMDEQSFEEYRKSLEDRLEGGSDAE